MGLLVGAIVLGALVGWDVVGGDVGGGVAGWAGDGVFFGSFLLTILVSMSMFSPFNLRSNGPRPALLDEQPHSLRSLAEQRPPLFVEHQPSLGVVVGCKK